MTNHRSEVVSQTSPEGQLNNVDSEISSQFSTLSENLSTAIGEESPAVTEISNSDLSDEAADAPTDSDAELTESYMEFETAFRRKHPAMWWSTLFGPVVVTAVAVGLVYLFAGPTYANKLVTMGAMALVFFGRFIILNGLDVSRYGEELLRPDLDLEDYFD